MGRKHGGPDGDFGDGPDGGSDDMALRTSGNLLADRRFLYGRDLAADGDHAAAADLYAQALELAPDWAAGWLTLGDAKARCGDREGAASAFRQAARLDRAGVLGAPLALASVAAGEPPSAADPAYVRALFDDYAPRFERHLAESLDYRGPALLRVRARPRRPAAGAVRAGARPWLRHRPHGRRAARARGPARRRRSLPGHGRARRATRASTMRSRSGDMLAALGDSRGESLDLAVAADVLVYVGDLGPVFRAVAAALRPGGLFAFTAQAGPEGDDVTVGADRRFAHSRDHVFARTAEAGLEVALCEPASTRRDAGRDVPGFLAVLRMSRTRAAPA